mmetsp:Transcript_4381/g.8065  ORF Transcript_4381/g.8065 Transcript_4381/m.8065 type:complete len:495 (-) Transcript_4381:121-1605(-)
MFVYYGALFRCARPQPKLVSGCHLHRKVAYAGLEPNGHTSIRHNSSSRAIEDSKNNLFVSCLPGLEPLLSEELKSLNIPHSQTAGGANLRDASVKQLLQCHLYLGTASHVLLRCGRPFSARNFAELRRKIAKMPWKKWLNQDSQIGDIRVTAVKSKLFHTVGITERVMKGIDEALGRQPQIPATSETVDADKAVRLTVRIERDTVQISIDTSSSPLHQRGYRLETAKAPLREDIAFAMLYSSGLKPRNAASDEIRRFAYRGILDPFCGSGTILIEAASLVAGKPPGRLRSAPLRGTTLFNPALWTSIVDDPLTKPLEVDDNILIIGSDRDSGAVAAAASNAGRAGVGDLVELQHAALKTNPWLKDPSTAPGATLVITNPPFGKRIKGKQSNKNPLLPLYQTFGDQVSRFFDAKPGSNATVLAHDVKVARRTGLSLTSLFSTHHGGLEVAAMSTVHPPKKPDDKFEVAMARLLDDEERTPTHNSNMTGKSESEDE